ncbi:hypothetical protein BDY19DRAFT_993833 [Irpex rosettiformis]|uniref:Uncharacterized protein n=1 Tax=Irpex rosettiformis TaxID=378272 RepID=A0ACB8U4D8_9APHY|nr:hypothetical protein BDY19DRAFT_993833 [Irpex rosettiformis]
MESLDAETLLGPFFVLLCVVFMLYGLFCAQTCYYYTTYHDHLSLKLAVSVLFVLETLHVIAGIHMLYWYLLVNYANPAKLTQIPWSVGLLSYLEHGIGALVQLFYIYRIWCVSKNTILTFILISLELTRIALGFRASSFVCIHHTWAALDGTSFGLFANLAFAFNIIVDSSIAFILTYSLHLKGRSSAYARSTKKILLKLTYYAITAGASTVLVSISVLIVYNRLRTTLAYIGLLQIIAKLNANSMLAMLNARKRIVREAKGAMCLELSDRSSCHQLQPQTTIHVFHETILTEDKSSIAERGEVSVQVSSPDFVARSTR